MSLLIPGPAGELEAIAWTPSGDVRAACVMCHPHPLFGGSMNSSVVFRAARGLQTAGLAVLRFNFRGVGRSSGEHDGSGGEADDLGAALDWMAREHPGVPLWAGGFSFGSRTAAFRATADVRIVRVVLVALPVLKFDCRFVRDVQQPGFILMASGDEYGTLAALRQQFPDLHAGLRVDEVPDANHFFEGKTVEVQRRVATYARAVLEDR
ncbi:MAG: alpha/beta hydrolase [Planctomycetota bacterium]